MTGVDAAVAYDEVGCLRAIPRVCSLLGVTRSCVPQLEESLRAAIVKLGLVDAELPPLPKGVLRPLVAYMERDTSHRSLVDEGCTFKLVVYRAEPEDGTTANDFFIPADLDIVEMGAAAGAVPLKSVASGAFRLQILAEYAAK